MPVCMAASNSTLVLPSPCMRDARSLSAKSSGVMFQSGSAGIIFFWPKVTLSACRSSSGSSPTSVSVGR